MSRRWAWSRLVNYCCRLCAGLVCLAGLTASSASSPTEYQVKAVFVFNFVKFTDWPVTAFTNATAPVIIGVVGEDPFGRQLDNLVKDETVCGRPLVVKRFRDGEEVAGCHVLFISRSARESLPALLANLKHKPVLTVGDCDRLCEQGGMINLVLSANGTVQPEINPAAARLAGVQISSRLLNLPTVRLVQTEH